MAMKRAGSDGEILGAPFEAHKLRMAQIRRVHNCLNGHRLYASEGGHVKFLTADVKVEARCAAKTGRAS